MSRFKGMSVLGIIVTTLIFSVCFYMFMTYEANATCSHFLNFDASMEGEVGSCWTAPNDFLGGTGVAHCTIARNGNVNCKCKGEFTLAGVFDSAIVGNLTDHCCIFGITEYAIATDNTHSVGTPGGPLNFVCLAKPE